MNNSRFSIHIEVAMIIIDGLNTDIDSKVERGAIESVSGGLKWSTGNEDINKAVSL